VAALTGDWAAAEAAYSRCAAAAAAAGGGAGEYAPFLGQALFCLGTTRARQGRHSEALAAYGESEAAGYTQRHALAQARGAALLALGRPAEAMAAVEAALGPARAAAGAAGPAAPGAEGADDGAAGFVDMTPVLLELRARIAEATAKQELQA
jgi:tetratricopeptide (TPR) repeat protein